MMRCGWASRAGRVPKGGVDVGEDGGAHGLLVGTRTGADSVPGATRAPDPPGEGRASRDESLTRPGARCENATVPGSRPDPGRPSDPRGSIRPRATAGSKWIGPAIPRHVHAPCTSRGPRGSLSTRPVRDTVRILTLTYEYPPLGGGGSRVARGLARAFVSAGHEIDVLTMGFRGLPKEEVDEGIRIRRVSCLRTHEDRSEPHELASYLVAALPLVLRRARSGRYDVNHSHFLFPDGVLSTAIGRFSDLPSVVTAHGSDVPGYNPHRFRRLHSALAPVWNGVVSAMSTIVSPSESLAELIRRQRPDTRIDVIPNGIDPDFLSPAREKKPRILGVSRIFERKGLQYVFEALEGGSHGFEVHIVGDGPYLPELRRRAARAGVPATFHGWLENDSPHLRELYETSSIFVLPSEAENFPVVLLEAQAAGLAIVTTDSTGCAEVVGDTGLLVPPHDVEALRGALTRLIRDPETRARLGSAGRRRMEENFSWESVAARYEEVFRRAIARSGGRSELRPAAGDGAGQRAAGRAR